MPKYIKITKNKLLNPTDDFLVSLHKLNVSISRPGNKIEYVPIINDLCNDIFKFIYPVKERRAIVKLYIKPVMIDQYGYYDKEFTFGTFLSENKSKGYFLIPQFKITSKFLHDVSVFGNGKTEGSYICNIVKTKSLYKIPLSLFYKIK